MAQDVDWERLYRETRHRIGNTMQMLLSLLRLQLREGGADTRETLQRLEVRMAAAAAAYALARVVPEGREGGRIVVDFNALIADMAEEARRQTEPGDVPELSLRLEPVEVGIEEAIPLGIAAMEILVNAVQHGGPPIHVILEPMAEDGWMSLTVRDGGSGVPEVDLRRDGIGLRITASLMRQVQGRLVLDQGPVRMEWPLV